MAFAVIEIHTHALEGCKSDLITRGYGVVIIIWFIENLQSERNHL